jgi:hypothetical protein
MPKCINDPKKSYKGDEPSPKGIGYCAHTEEIGTIKNGLNGNKWIISSTAKGVKRWVKYKIQNKNSSNEKENIKNNENKKNNNIKLNKSNTISDKLIKIYSEKESLKEKWWDNSDKCDCSKFVSYKRNKSRKYGINYKDIHGLEFEQGKLHKFISYNNFAKKPINIDQEAWIKYKLDEDNIKIYYCYNKKRLTKNNPIYKKINHIGYKKYFTDGNQCGNYLVYIKKEKDPVYIYRIPLEPDERYFPKNESGYNKEWAYIQLVAKVIPEKIFIGKCPYNLKNWNCKGKDGSSILLKINKLNYICIGPDVFTFTAKSEIIDFISLIPTNSDWPYPYAVDVDNNFYLMLHNVYGNKNKNKKILNDIYDPYRYYDENKDDFKEFDNLKKISYYD